MSEQLLVVRNFAVTPGNSAVRVSCDVHGGVEVSLWYEIRGLPDGAAIECADAFFAPCLLYAMKRGASVRFEVPISDSIADQAEDAAFVIGSMLGLARRPGIEFPAIVSVARKAGGAVMGFSSGIDSWFSFKKHFWACAPASKKLTHLLFNDVGANAPGKRDQARARAEAVASEHGLGLICVSSNVAEFLDMGFQKTHTLRNASVAHLLSPVVDTFYYSSGIPYADAKVFKAYDMAYADAILLPLLSSGSMGLRSSGSTYTRVEKTREILDIPRIGERLDVCVRHNHSGSKINCGRCWKCLRTELTLEALGALDLFEPAFNLHAYRKVRRFYLHTTACSGKAIEREVFDLARAAGLAGPRLLYLPGGALVNAGKKIRARLA